MRELYNLHTPFVIMFLAFVAAFIWAHRGSERRR
jgi:hypothetical protein